MAATATTAEPVLLDTTRSSATRPKALPNPNDVTTRVGGSAEAVCVSADVAFGILGVGRTAGYKSISHGTFPVRVIRVGRIIRVPLVPLRRVLGIAGDGDTESERLS